MEEDDFEEYEDPELIIYPERFNKWILLRAGLEFASHVAGGVQCAITILGRQVLAAEIYDSEKKNFEESVRASLEMLPESE